MKSVYLVLDMQNDLVSEDGPNGKSPLGVQVKERGILDKTAKANGIFKLGTSGTEIHSKPGKQDSDWLVTKHRVSPFYSTDRETYLRVSGIERIFCSGVSTQAVVQATVRDGHERDYPVVGAFSYFSLLPNMAEERHHIRRNRDNRREGAQPLPSTVRGLFADARARNVSRADAAKDLGAIRVHPVLTAHPTEVQRKSTLDCQLAIAEWLGRMDSADALPGDLDAATLELRRLIATLWQTRLLRAVKLGVRDEIENALAYFNYTFIDAVPRLVEEVEDCVAALPGEGSRPRLPTLVSVGSWVGGDRDGNPFVNAEMLEVAFRRQSEVIFDHYLAQVHALGGER